MDYIELAQIYEKLSSTSKRLEKTSYVAELIAKTKNDDLSMILLLLVGRLYPKYESDKKIGVAAKLVVKAITLASGKDSSSVEREWKQKGDLGDVAESLTKQKAQVTLFSEKLSVEKVFSNLKKLAEVEGAQSVNKKVAYIAELLTSADPLEAKYIVRTILEDLRVGVGEGTLRDAIVWSEFPQIHNLELTGEGNKYYFAVEHEAVEEIDAIEMIKNLNFSNTKAVTAKDKEFARELYNYFSKITEDAHNLTNDWARVVVSLREKGVAGLEETEIELGKPIKVMLYKKADSIIHAFEIVGKPAAFEYKYDGFRLQIEILADGKIILFTRNFEDVTKQFPQVVEYVKEYVDAKSAILEAECVGIDAKTGKYLPFQSISQRIKRKHNIGEVAKKFPVEVNLFDVIYHNGENLISAPFRTRRALLEKIITPMTGKIKLSNYIETEDEEEANTFYVGALDSGNEGVMAKNLDAIYKPGSRVGFGVKVKPVMESLDLVIVKAEHGEGKRTGWFTSFTVACLDDAGELQEIGKVSTGLKELDEEGVSYGRMTELLTPLISSEKGKTATVKPEIVIEVHYEEIQKSTSYASGYALRFPRFVRLRLDRDAENASSLELVEQLYCSQRGRNA